MAQWTAKKGVAVTFENGYLSMTGTVAAILRC